MSRGKNGIPPEHVAGHVRRRSYRGTIRSCRDRGTTQAWQPGGKDNSVTTVTNTLPHASKAHQPARRLLDITLALEPVWTWPAAAAVYFGVIFTSISFLILPALALLFLPFLLRWIRYGYLTARTPFDIPICFLLAAGAVGILVSEHATSLGAFGTMVAMSLLYYSVVNYRYPRHLMAAAVAGLVVGVAVYFLLALAAGGPRTENALPQLKAALGPLIQVLPKVPRPENWYNALVDTTHGLALAAVIAAVMLASLAVFSRGKATRAALLMAALVFGALMVGAATTGSLEKMLTGVSLHGRLTAKWLPVLTQVTEQWSYTLLGMGLGGDSSVWKHYPLHNSYLEVYVNLGLLGAIAVLWAGVVTAKMSLQFLRAKQGSRFWRGIAFGLVCSSAVAALAGMFESSPFSLFFRAKEINQWMISPVPWLLWSWLVVARRNLDSSLAGQPSGTPRIRQPDPVLPWSQAETDDSRRDA